MSSGQEHYKTAEELLERAKAAHSPEEAAYALKAAHVHAMLAVAAATAYPAVKDYIGNESTDSRRWTEMTGG